MNLLPPKKQGMAIDHVSSSAMWAIAILLHAVFVLAGKYHVDEGYYHLAPMLVLQGKLPYRDFLWVQAPLFPFIYALFAAALGKSLIAMRAVTALLALICYALTARTARRIGGPTGARLALLLTGCNPYLVYHLSYIKLYALTALLLSLAVDALARETPSVRHWCLASVCLALGASTRITVFPALAVFALVAVWRLKWQAVAPVLTAMAVLMACHAPWLALARESYTYGLFTYHAAKESFSLPRQFLYKVDSLSYVLRFFFLQTFCAILLLLVRADNLAALKEWCQVRPGVALAWLITCLTLAVHFTSQVPYVYEYLAVGLPALAALTAGALSASLSQVSPQLSRVTMISIAAGAVLNLAGYGKTDLATVQPRPAALYMSAVVKDIQRLTSAEATILTFNNSLAAEAGRNVLPGDEMNVLTYAPDWDEVRCREYHILNVDMLVLPRQDRELEAILVTKDSFIGNFPVLFNPGEEGARPTVMQAIKRFYRIERRYPNFGYFNRTAELYVPRPPGEELSEEIVPKEDDRKPVWPGRLFVSEG